MNGTITYKKEPFMNDKVNAQRTKKQYYWRNLPEKQQQQQQQQPDRSNATLNTYCFFI
jgi:hypothetical protein